MLSEDSYTLTGIAFAAVAIIAGLLTWLCVGWLGNQPLLTAMMAVVLVELFLACIGVIAILLAERMTVKMLDAEQHPAPAAAPQKKRNPVWLRITPPPYVMPETPSHDGNDGATTIPFPAASKRRDEVEFRPAA